MFAILKVVAGPGQAGDAVQAGSTRLTLSWGKGDEQETPGVSDG